VFARGGFDVVLGNPPWERVKLQEQEFFAPLDETIANASNAAARKKLIRALPTSNPALWTEWMAASRGAEGESHLIRHSGRYPLCGKGDVNTYAVFAEHNRSVLGPAGRAGFIVPAGIATDDTTKEFFQSVVTARALHGIYHFENEERIFVGVNNMFRFVLLTLGGPAFPARAAEVVTFARSTEALSDPARRYHLGADEFATLNPNTKTFPTFATRRDADINLAMYRRAGILWREDDPAGNPWGLRFMRMLDMTNDSGLFRTRAALEADGWQLEGNHFVLGGERALPLIEAKMVHHFNHRFATFEHATQANLNKGTLPKLSDFEQANPSALSVPAYWVHRDEVEARLAEHWHNGWLLGWRDITNAHNERTVVASLIPRVAVGNTTPLVLSSAQASSTAWLYANLCSFVLDYAARQKVGGTHLNYLQLKQLPVLAPAIYAADAAWSRGTTVGEWLLPRVVELTYTAWDLEPFARDVGEEGPPYLWDPARRAVLRAELDAAFFHLYGISRDDTAYILDTFPIVKKNDVKAHGEFRTKRVVLEVYDALAESARTGVGYVSPLGAPRRAEHRSIG
jgi:hypothetical protein